MTCDTLGPICIYWGRVTPIRIALTIDSDFSADSGSLENAEIAFKIGRSYLQSPILTIGNSSITKLTNSSTSIVARVDVDPSSLQSELSTEGRYTLPYQIEITPAGASAPQTGQGTATLEPAY